MNYRIVCIQDHPTYKEFIGMDNATSLDELSRKVAELERDTSHTILIFKSEGLTDEEISALEDLRKKYKIFV